MATAARRGSFRDDAKAAMWDGTWLIVVGVIAIELCLSGFWVPAYFRIGIPLFKRRILHLGKTDHILSPEALSKILKTALLPSIDFRQIGSHEIAFRERMLHLSLINYTPMMHGIIRSDPASRSAVVTGHANMFPICFLAAFSMALIGSGDIGEFQISIMIAALLILGLCYAIQAWRFTGVCKAVERELNAE